jgi:anti-sigma B factor antagonist
MPMQQGHTVLTKLRSRRFQVRSHRTDEHHQVSVSGEMDLSVTDEVDREMRRAEASDAKSIVLDLNRLDFMDASGIRLLLKLDSRSRDNGGRLRIMRSPAPQVRRVLALTGADQLLPLVD